MSLFVQLHDIVVRLPAHRTLVALLGALYACGHVAAWDEGSVAVGFVAELAEFATGGGFLLRRVFLNHLWSYLLLMEPLLHLLMVILCQLRLLLIQILPRPPMMLHPGVLVFHRLVLCHLLILLLLLHKVLLLLILYETRYWLVLRPLLIDHWHCFQICDIWALDNKHCRPYLDYVSDFERMQTALFPF